MSSNKRKADSSDNSGDDPPPSSSASNKIPRRQWRCDVCNIALFDTYEDAVVHEQACEKAKREKESEKDERKQRSAVKIASRVGLNGFGLGVDNGGGAGEGGASTNGGAVDDVNADNNIYMKSKEKLLTKTPRKTPKQKASISSFQQAEEAIHSKPAAAAEEEAESDLNESFPRYDIGDIVKVQHRTWSGRNDLGGVARIVKVHTHKADGDEDGCYYAYDVKYILENRREKQIEEQYVDVNVEYESPNKDGRRRKKGGDGDGYYAAMVGKKSEDTTSSGNGAVSLSKQSEDDDNNKKVEEAAATKGSVSSDSKREKKQESLAKARQWHDIRQQQTSASAAVPSSLSATTTNGKNGSAKKAKNEVAAAVTKKSETSPRVAVKSSSTHTKKKEEKKQKGTVDKASDEAAAKMKQVEEDAASKKKQAPAKASSKKRKTNWRCDICLIAVFEDYNEAVEHEAICKGASKKKAKTTATTTATTATVWTCDVCNTAKFDSYDEAAMHEKKCAEEKQQKEKKKKKEAPKPIIHMPPIEIRIKNPKEMEATKVVKPTAKLSPKMNDKKKTAASAVDEGGKSAKLQTIPHNDSFEHSPTSAFSTLRRQQKQQQSVASTAKEVAQTNVSAVDATSSNDNKMDAAKSLVSMPQSFSKTKEEPTNIQQEVSATVPVEAERREGTEEGSADASVASSEEKLDQVKEPTPAVEGSNDEKKKAGPTSEDEPKQRVGLRRRRSSIFSFRSSDEVIDGDENFTKKKWSPTRMLFFTILPVIILAATPDHLREGILSTLMLPHMASITLTILFLAMIAYWTFAFAMIVTHEGTHHHEVRGSWLAELSTAAQDIFRKPVAATMEEGAMPLPPAITLREYLMEEEGFHMAFAPAFFGFFAYFGALAAMEEETNGRVVPKFPGSECDDDDDDDKVCCGLNSVAGASAGAMAAVMLSAGIQPRQAAEFSGTITWGMVADSPGLGGYVKGNNFEEYMRQFMSGAAKIRRDAPSGDEKSTPFQLEEALVPVAVSGFDLLRMKGLLLRKGCLARAARSSAGFPGLFQPVAWREESNNESGEKKRTWLPDSLLIDGGITDGLGLNGLGGTSDDEQKKRVINMVVGDFGFQGPSGIESMPPGVNASSLVSIALVGTPMCGPWAMQNGPRAVESARKAMAEALDTPMERVVSTSDDHYLVKVDASKWLV